MSRMTALVCKSCLKPVLKDQLVFDDGQPKHRQCMLDQRRPPPAPSVQTPTPSARVKSQEMRTDVARQPANHVVASGTNGYDVETASGQRITPEPVPLEKAQSLADAATKPKSKDRPKPTGRK